MAKDRGNPDSTSARPTPSGTSRSNTTSGGNTTKSKRISALLAELESLSAEHGESSPSSSSSTRRGGPKKSVIGTEWDDTIKSITTTTKSRPPPPHQAQPITPDQTTFQSQQRRPEEATAPSVSEKGEGEGQPAPLIIPKRKDSRFHHRNSGGNASSAKTATDSPAFAFLVPAPQTPVKSDFSLRTAPSAIPDYPQRKHAIPDSTILASNQGPENTSPIIIQRSLGVQQNAPQDSPRGEGKLSSAAKRAPSSPTHQQLQQQSRQPIETSFAEPSPIALNPPFSYGPDDNDDPSPTYPPRKDLKIPSHLQSAPVTTNLPPSDSMSSEGARKGSAASKIVTEAEITAMVGDMCNEAARFRIFHHDRYLQKREDLDTALARIASLKERLDMLLKRRSSSPSTANSEQIERFYGEIDHIMSKVLELERGTLRHMAAVLRWSIINAKKTQQQDPNANAKKAFSSNNSNRSSNTPQSYSAAEYNRLKLEYATVKAELSAVQEDLLATRENLTKFQQLNAEDTSAPMDSVSGVGISPGSRDQGESTTIVATHPEGGPVISEAEHHQTVTLYEEKVSELELTVETLRQALNAASADMGSLPESRGQTYSDSLRSKFDSLKIGNSSDKKAALAENQEAIRAKDQEITRLQIQVQDLEQKYEDAMEQQQFLHQTLSKKQEDRSIRDLEEERSINEQLRERLNALEHQIDEQTKRQAADIQELKELRGVVAQSDEDKRQIESLLTELSMRDAALGDLEEKMRDHRALAQRVKELEFKLTSVSPSSLDELHSQITAKEAEIKTLTKRMSSTKAQLKQALEIANDVDEIQSVLHQKNNELLTASKAIEELERVLSEKDHLLKLSQSTALAAQESAKQAHSALTAIEQIYPISPSSASAPHQKHPDIHYMRNDGEFERIAQIAADLKAENVSLKIEMEEKEELISFYISEIRTLREKQEANGVRDAAATPPNAPSSKFFW